jgi:hypothetical protein
MRERIPSASIAEIAWPRRCSMKDATASRFLAGEDESGRNRAGGGGAGGGTFRSRAICKEIRIMDQELFSATHLTPASRERLCGCLLLLLFFILVVILAVVIDIDG